MIKALATIGIATGMLLWGKLPGDMLFSKFNRGLHELIPQKEATNYFPKAKRVYIYIYSKKPFKGDRLYLMFVHLDSKTGSLPKMDIQQTLDIDVVPGSIAAKTNVVLYKSGQYIVSVYDPVQPKKPIAKSHLLIEE